MGAFIAKLFGGDVVGGISKIIDQFHLSPEEKIQAEQAKALLAAHEEELQIGLQEHLAQFQESNLESARARQAAVKDLVPSILAVVIVGSTLYYVYWVTRYSTGQNRDLVTLSLGYLFGLASSVFLYYFGSSSGSAAKSETLAKALNDKKSGT